MTLGLGLARAMNAGVRVALLAGAALAIGCGSEGSADPAMPSLLSEVANSIAAKAIRDGAIHAILDHANGWLVSKDTGDIYSTAKPLAVFSSRIASCLNLHNEAVNALRFPAKTSEEKDSDEYWIESQVLYEELAREYMDEDETYF